MDWMAELIHRREWRAAACALLAAVTLTGLGAAPAEAAPMPVACASNTLPPPLKAVPGPATTGVPRGALKTRHDGDVTVSRPGAVISGAAVGGVLTVAADNVTIKCSHVAEMIEVEGGVTGTRIWFTTIGVAGTDRGGAAGIRPDNFTARRVEITGTTDGIRTMGPNVDVRDSWIHHLYDDGPAHNDAAHVSTGTTNLTFAYNRVDSTAIGPGAGYQTSGMILFNTGPIKVVGNLFSGKPSTHINAGRAEGPVVLARNTFTATSRDAPVKGLDKVKAVANRGTE